MRRHYLLAAVPLILACAKGETPPADSAAMAPAALTEADVAGTWTGTAMLEGTDSVFAHWTNICGGAACRLTTTESPKDTISQTYVLEADSMRGTSAPHAAPAPEMKGAMVIDNWVARFSGGQVTGTGMLKLADKPDSVVMRYRFTGSKAP